MCACIDQEEEQFVAVHAFSLGEDGLGPQLFDDIALIVDHENCHVMQLRNHHLDCFKHCFIVLLYRDDSFMFRSRFTSSSSDTARAGSPSCKALADS